MAQALYLCLPTCKLLICRSRQHLHHGSVPEAPRRPESINHLEDRSGTGDENDLLLDQRSERLRAVGRAQRPQW